MRALVLRDQLEFVTDYPVPEPAPGEAVLRVIQAGICNTDLELLRGYKGFHGVLGHEFVARIHALPDDVRGWSLGERVVSEINVSPAATWQTRAQDWHRAALGIFGRDGAFADFVRVPLENLHRVPDTLSDDQAVFTEPLAAACQILEQVQFKTSDRVVVLGDGKLGLLCAQVIHTVPCELTAMGRHMDKLEILRKRGIQTMLASDWNGARDADVVIECTGSSAGFEQARKMLRPHGMLVLKSTYANSGEINLSSIVVDEITVIGSRCGPFQKALTLLEAGQVSVEPLIQARYTLSDGLEAFRHAGTKGTLKVLLEVS